MTRTWAPTMKQVQEAIRNQIQAEYEEQGGINPAGPSALPTGMSGNVFVGVAANAFRAPSKPFSIQILPAEDSELDTEVSNHLQGTLNFVCLLRAKADDEKDQLEAIRELQGLVIDGVNRDLLLGGLVGGPAAPAFSLRRIEVGAAEVGQELAVRLIARRP